MPISDCQLVLVAGIIANKRKFADIYCTLDIDVYRFTLSTYVYRYIDTQTDKQKDVIGIIYTVKKKRYRWYSTYI